MRRPLSKSPTHAEIWESACHDMEESCRTAEAQRDAARRERDEWAEECDKRGMLWRESERQLAAANKALEWVIDVAFTVKALAAFPDWVIECVDSARAAEGSE